MAFVFDYVSEEKQRQTDDTTSLAATATQIGVILSCTFLCISPLTLLAFWRGWGL